MNAAKKATGKISLHYLLASSGYFGLLSTLVIVLSAKMLPAAEVGMLAGLFAMSSKVAKIPLAPWLDKLSPAVSVLSGCSLAGAAFAVVGLAQQTMVLLLALLVGAVGISINALSAKQLAAAAADLSNNRARVFSIVNIALNLSSAVAAPVALFLVGRQQYTGVMLLVAGIYFLAGGVAYFNFNERGHSITHKTGSAVSFKSYLQLFRIEGMKPFMLVNAMGWFLYGQLFNALALYLSQGLHLADRLGWLYTLNALMVVGLQLAVTHISQRVYQNNAMKTIQSAYLLQFIAFALPVFIPGYMGALAFVALFTVAEMLFMPNTDVVLTSLVGAERRAIGYSVLSLSSAVGEASGGSLGIVLFHNCAHQGIPQFYWALLAGLSVVFAVATWLLTTRPAFEQKYV